MSVHYDSDGPVKLYVREERSDDVARFVAERGEAIIVNGRHELEDGNALRCKRFCHEIGDGQLSASLSMVTGDLAAGRLIRSGVDWPSVCAEADCLSAATTAGVGVRTIDLLHVAAALDREAPGLACLDRRRRAAADLAGLTVVDITG